MTFSDVLATLKHDFPTITFRKSDYFYWSPYDKTVYYSTEKNNDATRIWTLLHETAHGLLNHVDFKSDFHLIKLESEAWSKTSELCKLYELNQPEEDYIQDCIDTYRNWQYRRSLCPVCDSGGVQERADAYWCLQCRNSWLVTKQRFCRVYRKNKTALQ